MSGELKLKTRYWKTTRTIVVLSEAFDAGTADDVEQMELSELNTFVTEGHGVLYSDKPSSVEVTPKQMAELLYDAGSEPGFFQLDEKGKPTD